MHYLSRALKTVLIVIAVSGCSHPLEIVGQGDIISASGDRDCLLEDFQASDPKCTENFVVRAYDEEYTAVPRAGWTFRGWQTYCPYSPTATICPLVNSAGKVFQNWGGSAPALRAEFIEDDVIESLAPILGAVTDTSIKIWQAAGSEAEFKVRYRAGTDPWTETAVAVDLNAASSYVGTIELTGLQPGTLYDYQTLLNDAPGHTGGTFSTLPSAPGFTGQIRFGVGTDISHFEKPFLALGEAATKNFDFMLLVGDLMYADYLPPSTPNTQVDYMNRYWVTWNEENFGALSTTTPLYMMWDDHEIQNDFWPGKSLPDRYPAARAAYDRYVGDHNPDTTPDATGDVIYYTFSAPGADFFVLDTRSYRDPNTDVDDINKSMLGDDQRNALLDYLGNSTAAFKFIMTSVPFALGEESSDTWSSFQTERELILWELEDRGISNVVFVSGDRHFSGVFRIISPGGYVYYDFLPSPTAAGTRPPPAENGNPGQEEIAYISGIYRSFGDFQIDLSGATPTLRVAFVDDTGVDRCVINIGNNETGVLAGGHPLASCE